MEGVVPLDQEAYESHHNLYRHLPQDVVKYDVGAKFSCAPQEVLLPVAIEKNRRVPVSLPQGGRGLSM